MKDNELILPYNFAPREYQKPFFKALESGYRYCVLRWHRRAGKDKACFNALIPKMFERVGLYVYVFPTEKMATQAVWENIDNDGFRLLNHLIPPEIMKDEKLMKQLGFKINNLEHKITLPNGSILRLTGLTNIDAIRGQNPVGIIFSEYAFSNPEAWQSFSPIITQNEGFVVFNSTPNRYNDHFEQLCLKAQHNPDMFFYSELQCYNTEWENYNKLVNENVIKEERLIGTPEDQIIREYGCRLQGAVEGSFYQEYLRIAREQGRIGCYNYNPNYPVDCFFDIGTRDSTCIWFRQIIGNKIIFFDFIEDNGKDLEYYVQRLYDKDYNYRSFVLPHDANNKSFITSYNVKDLLTAQLNQYKLKGEVYTTVKTRVIQGINAVRRRFNSYHFSAIRCGEALAHLENYSKRKLADGTYSDEPKHDKHSHCADALRTEATFEELDKSGGTDLFGCSNIHNLPDSIDYDYDGDNDE